MYLLFRARPVKPSHFSAFLAKIVKIFNIQHPHRHIKRPKVSLTLFRSTSKAKSHMKAIKIGAMLVVVTFLSFTPVLLVGNSDQKMPGYFNFFIYINNFANFFVYFWIDDKFRNWVLRRSKEK